MTEEAKGALDADTPTAEDGAAVADQGVGNHPIPSDDTDEYNDPKSGGTPVQPAPTADSQADDPDAEDAEDADKADTDS